MDILQQVDIAAEALAVDAAIAAWQIGTYPDASGINVLVGGDLRNPPGREACPYLMLVPMDFMYGHHAEAQSAGIGLVVCVYDETKATRPGFDNITEYPGGRNAETLRRLACTAIAAALDGDIDIPAAEVEYDPLEEFPFHLNYTLINLVEPQTVDHDQFVG